MHCRANMAFEYTPNALPQESEPVWAVLGSPNDLRAEVLDGVLQVRTDKASWSQWRIGMAAGGGREFGDATALQLPAGGALTLDFEARLIPGGPDLPTFTVALSNGSSGPSVTFSPGMISISGVRKPLEADTTAWGKYRMVVEGTQFDFYCVNTNEHRKAELSAGDWGLFINFGFPALQDGLGAPERSFEVKSIRWQSGVADRQFPSEASAQ